MSDDVEIGIALLEEVEKKIVNQYGDVIAKGPGAEYDVKYDVSNKELQKQLDIAEKKLGGSQEGQAYLSFLRGRLLAIKQSPMGNRTMTQCIGHYQKAMDLGYNKSLVLYYMAMHHKAWNNKEGAILLFEKILQLEGTNSKLGIEAGAEIEKVKAQKSGGCFIATACYESYSSPEVMILRNFRDRFLSNNLLGKMFVKVYYFTSPPIANFISKREALKVVVRKFLIAPLVYILENKDRRK